jgi:hypothetical protein
MVIGVFSLLMSEATLVPGALLAAAFDRRRRPVTRARHARKFVAV